MGLQRFTLPADKANHVIWGLLVALLATAAATWLGQGLQTPVVAAAAALLAGLAKEAADAWANRTARRRGEREPHTVDPLDVLATAAGGLLLTLALLLNQGAAP